MAQGLFLHKYDTKAKLYSVTESGGLTNDDNKIANEARVKALALVKASNLSDLADAATARTNLGVAIGSDVQAHDAELDALAALTSAADKGIQFTGSGSAATYDLTAAGKALLDDADAAAQRVTMGVEIGVDVQAYDAQLADIAGLSPTDSNFIVGDGSNFVLESGATARSSLGLGSMATQNSGSVSISGGAIAGITDLAVADGGTGASSAADARTNLGLAIGSDVQAYDAQLADIAALTPTDGHIIVGDGSNFVQESGATARASLGLTIGTDVQAFDDQLADIAALSLSDGDFLVGDGSGAIVAESGATVRTSLGLGTGDSPAFTSISLSGQSAALAMNSQKITGLADPTADQDAATKAYVDSTKAGLDVKESVRVASTAHISASYNSSAKTLTASSAGVFSVDGVETALNDRILVKDQSTGSNNGIYKVTTAGAAGSGTGPNTSSAFTDGDYQYNSFVSTNISTTNFNTSAGFDASTTSLTWSSYSGASFQIDHRSIIVIKSGGGNVAYRMTADPAGFSFSGGSAATLPLDGKGLVASHSTTSAISIGAYISGIDVYEPKSAGPEFSLDDVLTGTLDQNTTSISIKTSSSPISYSGWEGGTLSAPFYIEVADSSSNKWYWKVTADVNNFDTSITVEFDEDDSHNATPSFNLGSDFGSAHSAGDIDFFASGSGGSPVAAVLTRADDFDSSDKITAGAFTFVAEGTSNSDAGFVLTTNDAITLDSTALSFTQFSGAGQLTAGDGIQKSGNTISADLKANGGVVIESSELAVDLGASSITGTLAVGDGGTGATSASAARTALGLAIGSDVQAYDAQLADIAALSPTDANFIVGDGSNFVLESGATARSSLGLVIGTDVQAYDAQLADVAGLTPADGAFIVGDGSNFVAESGSDARASLGLNKGKASDMGVDLSGSGAIQTVTSSNPASPANFAALQPQYVFDMSGAGAARTFNLPTSVGATAGAIVGIKIKGDMGSGASLVIAAPTASGGGQEQIENASGKGASLTLDGSYQAVKLMLVEAHDNSSSAVHCWSVID
tara:strand:- start:54931 stop:58035 length:3105 start_codon:yes stop_codon:yes gene_type:complete